MCTLSIQSTEMEEPVAIHRASDPKDLDCVIILSNCCVTSFELLLDKAANLVLLNADVPPGWEALIGLAHQKNTFFCREVNHPSPPCCATTNALKSSTMCWS